MTEALRHQRPCPICDSLSWTSLFDNQLASFDELDLSYTLASCNSCGFVYASELAQTQTFNEYYSRFSKYDITSSISHIDSLRFSSITNIICQQAPKDALILDIGCGNGAMLNALSQVGFRRLHGIEPAPKAKEFAKRHFGITTIERGDLSTAALSSTLEIADWVIVLAVTEHLYAPKQDLKKLLSQMKPGSHLIIEVPNMANILEQSLDPYGEFSQEHIQFFNEASLQSLLYRCGAIPIGSYIVKMPSFSGESLISVFRVTDVFNHEPTPHRNDLDVSAYIHASELSLRNAVDKIKKVANCIYLYGAGAHSARLMPRLTAHGVSVSRIFDQNPNLQGKKLGGLLIEAPAAIEQYERLPIVVSSFRAQAAMAHYLSVNHRNPIVSLYTEQVL